MPNIGMLLKTEIVRLCRREVRQEIAAVKKSSAAYRRDIAGLKRRVRALESTSRLLAKQATSSVKRGSAPLPGRSVRFVAKGLRSLRVRLGLSASQLAMLIGVSEQSIYNWESKKATPRKEQQAVIVSLRSLGKPEAQRRLHLAKTSRGAHQRKAAK